MGKRPHKTRNLIITSVVVAIISGIVDYFFELGVLDKLLSALGRALTGTWKLLADIYELPGWSILVLALGSIGLVAGICFSIAQRRKAKKETPPPGTVRVRTDILNAYTSDTIYDIGWRWEWVEGDIANLRPVCPTCDATLVYSDEFGRHTKLICEPCSNIVQDHLKHQGTTVLDFGRPRIVVEVNNIDLDGLHASVKREIRRVAVKRSQDAERADANGGS